MLGRFKRIIIMNRTVIVVVMAVAMVVSHFMRQIKRVSPRRPATLQCQRMQGQDQEQKNANKSAHGRIGGNECWAIITR